MYTQCPACSTLFRITPEQLHAAGGKVRCGECHTVFHAPDHLTEDLPAEIRHAAPAPQDEPLYETLLREPPLPEEPALQEELPQAPAEPAADMGDALSIDLDGLFAADTAAVAVNSELENPTDAPDEATPPTPADPYGEEGIEALLKNTPDAASREHTAAEFELPWDTDGTPPAGEEDAALDTALAGDTAPDGPDLPEPAAAASPAPLSPLSAMLADEASASPRPRLLAGTLWTLGSLLLLATLALQYIYLNRALMVVHYPEFRPLLEPLCELTGCQLPAQRDLSALTLLERDIRSHEQYQGALTISATLLNRATFAQPYPAVEVVMRDLGGKVVAARRFQPQEYLAGGLPGHLLAAQGTAQLKLDVVDPGAEAVGFEFTFH